MISTLEEIEIRVKADFSLKENQIFNIGKWFQKEHFWVLCMAFIVQQEVIMESKEVKMNSGMAIDNERQDD